MGIMLVFDLTDERSFNNIQNWMHSVDQYGSEGVSKILVGNKCDLNEKRVFFFYSYNVLSKILGY